MKCDVICGGGASPFVLYRFSTHFFPPRMAYRGKKKDDDDDDDE